MKLSATQGMPGRRGGSVRSVGARTLHLLHRCRPPGAVLLAAAGLLLLAPALLLGASALSQCTARARHQGAYGEEAARNLTAFRAGLLGRALALNFSTTFGLPGQDAWRHYDLVNPFLSCPRRHPGGLLRYGGGGDGGKLLCDLGVLRAPCLVYSMGSNGDYGFERDILSRTPCEVHTFDCTYNGTSVQPARHFYHRTCIGVPPRDGEAIGGAPNVIDGGAAPLAPSGGPGVAAGAAAAGQGPAAAAGGAAGGGAAGGAPPLDFRPLGDVMSGLGHAAQRMDLMKVDIEGHEVEVLSTLRPEDQLPDQLVIELHFFRNNPVPGVATISPAAPRDSAQLSLLLAHMASLGYGIVARDDNTMTTDVACCTEVTFLRVEGGGGAAAAGWPRIRDRALTGFESNGLEL
ncbi:MAG: methyltransferase domain-containing protein [Monoraphidium minutum]|nr:MAG: methyltransferase domain-containing protein [Monoraphidium minutum]